MLITYDEDAFVGSCRANIFLALFWHICMAAMGGGYYENRACDGLIL